MRKKSLVLGFMLIMLLAFGTGIFGQNYCLDFDGVNDYVELGTPDDITSLGQGSFTYEAWINTETVNTRQCIVGNWSWDYDAIVLELYSSGQLRFYVNSNGYNSPINTDVDDGEWHHVAGVRDITNGRILMYVDGVEVYNQIETTSSFTLTKSTRIGRNDEDDWALYFEGTIDEVRLWSDAREQTEIENNMYNELAGDEDNLVAYYKLNEESGQTAFDSAGSNDGRLGTTSDSDIADPIWVLSDSPLPVILSNFSAFYNNEILTINWATESEENNTGWNIYRGTAEDALQNGAVIQINNQLIAGAGTTNISTEYSYIDEQQIQAGETYWYWLEDVSSAGETEIHPPTSLSIPMGDPPDVPTEYGLHQNYPNPFNPSTTISFTLDTESTEKVEIEIFNLKGQKIRTYPVILNEDDESTNYYSIIWNGKDEHGKAVSSGVYYYKLNAGKDSEMKKMILLK